MGSKWAKTMIFSKKVVKNQLFCVSRFWIIQLRTGLWTTILKISLTSTGVLKKWNIRIEMSYEQGVKRQYWPNQNFLKFFCGVSPKNAKNGFFAFRQITWDFDIETHIQGTTMRKLTSRRFRKCGSFWTSEFLNGSYRPSKMDESEKTAPSTKIRGVKKK